MARTYEISFKLGAQMAGNFAKTMASASGSLGQLNDRIGELSRQAADTDKLVRLRDKVADTTREYASARERVDMLADAMAATDSPTKDMTREFDRAQKAAERVQDKLYSQREELSRLNNEMGTTSTSTADLVQQQERLARASERAQNAQAGLQKSIAARDANLQTRDNLRGQLFDAAGLAATLALPIREAVQFESVMADVNKVANLQADQLKALEGNINRLSGSTGIARDQIAAMYEAAAQAGYARKEWGAYVDTASKMAVAFDMAGEESGNMLRAWRSGMSLTMDQATALGNTVNHLSNNMNANAAAVGEVIQRQGAVAKQAGLTTQEVAGLSAALLSSGASPEIAATGLKNLTGALTDGEAATARQRQALSSLGLDAVELAKRMQTDATGAINDVFNRLNQAPEYKRNSLISMLFGEESKGAIAPLIGNLGEFRKAMTLAVQETSSMQEEYNVRQQTTERNLKRMAQTSKVLAGTLGAVLLPALNEIMTAVTPLVAGLAAWADQNPQLTTTIVGITAALVAGKVAAIAGGFAFTYLRGAWLAGVTTLKTLRVAYLLHTGALTAGTQASRAAIVVQKGMAAAQWAVNAAVAAGKWTWATAKLIAYKTAQLVASGAMKALTAAQWLLNAALSANPIGLVIAAIAALVAAGIWMWKNWDKVTTFFTNAWAYIKQLFAGFKPLQLMMGAFNALTSWVAGWWQRLTSSFSISLSGLGKLLLAFNPLGLIMAGFTAVRSWVGGWWQRLTRSFSGGLSGLGNMLRSFNPLALIRGAFNRMLAWVNNFSLFNSGKKLLSTLASGIRAAVSGPVNAIKSGLSKVRQYLPFSDAKVGPLSELTKSGSAIMKTLSEGMGKVPTGQMMRPFAKTSGDMIQQFQAAPAPAAPQPGSGERGLGGALNRLARSNSRASSPAPSGGGVTLDLTQNIYMGGGSGDVADQARAGATQGAEDMLEQLRGAMTRERRLSYG